MEEDGEDGGGGSASMRRKAVKALKTLRANMPAALAKGVAEKDLEEGDGGAAAVQRCPPLGGE